MTRKKIQVDERQQRGNHRANMGCTFSKNMVHGAKFGTETHRERTRSGISPVPGRHQCDN